MEIIWSNKKTVSSKPIKEQNLEWIIQRAEKCSDRYIHAERALLVIIKMPWYKRLFIKKDIIKFLDSRKEFYDF